MSTQDLSPRLAELLPPTLVPHAVAMAAPRPDRALSLGMSCLLYTALGALLVASARQAPRLKTPVTFPVTWEDPGSGTVPEPPRVAPPPAAPTGVRPQGLTVVQPRFDENVVPVTVPDGFGKDRSNEIAGGPEGPAGPTGVAGVPVTVATPLPPPAPARPSGPVEVEIRQLRILSQVAPVYPALARLTRTQGVVVLRMSIDERGVPTEVTVVSGPHPLLVAEAQRVARLWRFQPMTLDGVPVPATFMLNVGFRLEK